MHEKFRTKGKKLYFGFVDLDWLKKCVEYDVEGARPRGRPKKTWERDCGKRLLGAWIKQGGCCGSY